MRKSFPYERVSFLRSDERFLYVKSGEKEKRVLFAHTNYYGDWTYLPCVLRPGMQLNLVRPYEAREATLAELIIIEPDFLIDISSLAACIETYAPQQFLLNRFLPSASSRASVLLGNFSGNLLDEALHHPDAPLPYAESARRFFRTNALDLAACPEINSESPNASKSFHAEAMRQSQNLYHILRQPDADGVVFRPERLLLEPSFLCEMLGLQGRMDMLQDDYRVLVEQKSGKLARNGAHREPHYAQMLLYQALLHYAYGIPNREIRSYLLYSRYPDGLLREGPAPLLLGKMMELRNRIVFEDRKWASGEGREAIESCQAEDLRANPRLSDSFWQKYLRPKYADVLDTIHSAAVEEKSYFYRFLRFVALEQRLARLGASGEADTNCVSALWKMSFREKLETGSILAPLAFEPEGGERGKPVSFLTFNMGSDEQLSCNFRVGDGVLAYPYEAAGEPDVRSGVVMRGSIEAIDTEQVRVRLLSPQNPFFLQNNGSCYALEHDFIDISRPLFRGLSAFLKMPRERRDLLLGRRSPATDESRCLRGDYGPFNELVAGALCAEDYFLVIGPPGTGKTSFGLLNVVKEALLQDSGAVLLSAYTNRAVDEICSKLLEAGIDFLRIGREVQCCEESRPRLLSKVTEAYKDVAELKRRLGEAKVFAGTLATLCATPSLFALRRFRLAVVDEASQILEPQMMPLWAAMHGDEPAIGKFVLIGDHKQLPAVVLQGEQESAVTEPELQKIGLRNCRNSLFERLLRLSGGQRKQVFRMNRQGRMHPEVASFAGEAFYGGKLVPVPLEHQTKQLDFQIVGSPLEQLLASRRFCFLDTGRVMCETIRTNDVEAAAVARLCMAEWALLKRNGRPFKGEESIGIIVPFRNQIARIRQALQAGIQRLPEEEREEAQELQRMTIDTVERFQGSQREMIVYSFTASRCAEMEFLTSQTFREEEGFIDRKLNVAMTRARESLLLVGNADFLAAGSPVFRRLVAYAKEHDALLPVPAFGAE